MNAPKPGPRPGARPGVRPGPPAGAAPVSTTVAPSVEDAAAHGRIDDAGVVWLTVPAADGDGPSTERRIGEWKAGTVAEGLAHYARRFADLTTEVEVLVARLGTHPEDVARVRDDARRLREGLPEAAVLGDVARLDRRLSELLTTADQVEARVAEHRVELVVEAERIADSGSDWKSDGDRLNEIGERWNSAGGDRAARKDLAARFRAARETFNSRRGSHFADLDKQRDAARRAKEKLVAQAVALQDSTNWNETARAYRDLMAEWKAAGRARRADDDRLWAEFRHAQDVFFGARDEDNRRKDAEFEQNAEAKQSLLDEYDARIDPAAGQDRARDLLRELQEKWDAIGFVPRARVQEFEDKIGALESRVSDYAEQQWRRTDPEVEARVAQFRAKVDQLTADADAAEARGRGAKAAELRGQAEQWRSWAQTAADAARD
ncbi:DUF349 domain-containing protein [Corynebacterium glyciniphilum]|uniref:DUF349 domain-containing protein n=1 Tax=Corynebacterium glyciniphilum TaxID=1404244 RepID=UPI00264D7393|nr:DUF349 domain-containing protein [Corynebacterium glyciniphilum]MDN5683433.1 DUF349 domain-containing protein [Corynebacterium glyciniphilum]MDN6705659.1 DUF349 domain-containing protein [Corynebacterium glyciniphilum]